MKPALPPMVNQQYLNDLFEIARHLNKEFSLPSALRKALEKTVELLDLQTGWIWLVQEDVKSVYLAASYNLPPALSEQPERLSGWCFCIEKYLSDNISSARNISEIACSRLKNLKSGTRDLKFHATIPITYEGRKVGLINLVSRESQQLTEEQLSALTAIAELIGVAIQRTRLQDTYLPSHAGGSVPREMVERIIRSRIETLLQHLRTAGDKAGEEDTSVIRQAVDEAVAQLQDLDHQLSLIIDETPVPHEAGASKNDFNYPTSPLSARELEVLTLVRKGFTNGQIAEQLYIAERTVKFHLSSILSKLFAKTRTEAVNIALQRGLLSA